MDILFSVIIPVYNTAAYLRRCVYSVIQQPFSSYEIILVNDASTDSSETVILELIRENPDVRIRYVKHTHNQGVSAARNTGLDDASGEYILWLDSDDMLSPDALNGLHEAVKGRPDVVINTIDLCEMLDADNYRLIKKVSSFDIDTAPDKSSALAILKQGIYIASPAYVVKKNLLTENNILFLSGIRYEDELWVPQVICAGASFVFNRNGFYLYFVDRPDSFINTPDITRQFDKFTVIEELKKVERQVNGSAEKIFLRKREAALQFGLIISLNAFADNPRYAELARKMKSPVYMDCLNFEKYKLIKLLCGLAGLELSSRLLTKIGF